MSGTINLFVYGYLRFGNRIHFRYFPRDLKFVPGKIEGNLYCGSGWPYLKIPENAEPGTADYQHDIEVQEANNRMRLSRLHFHLEFGRVYGELYRLPVDSEIIQNLEQEKEYLASLNCGDTQNMSYFLDGVRRSLVAVLTDDWLTWAWTYHYPNIDDSCVHILTGDWRDCFNGGGIRSELSLMKETKESYLRSKRYRSI